MSIPRAIFLDEISKIKYRKPNTFVNNGNGLVASSKDLLINIRNLNGIGQDEEIYIAFYHYVFTPSTFWNAERSHYNCVIFLDDRICVRSIEETTGWDRSDDYVEDFYWDAIDEVDSVWQYTGDDPGNQIKVYSIRLFSTCGTNMFDIPLKYFGGFSDEKDSLFLKDLLNQILAKYKCLAEEEDNNIDYIIEQIKENLVNEQFETTLSLIRSNFDLDEIDPNTHLYYFLIYYIASSFKGLEKEKEALKIINERFIEQDESEGYQGWASSIINLRAELHGIMGNNYLSLQDYYKSYKIATNIEEKSTILQNVNTTYSKFKDTFSSLNYDERKTILIYDEIRPSSSKAFVILDKNNMPDNLNFPVNHPKMEELYIGHPYIDENYLPVAAYEASLFNDRFEEFSYFIQCLGAKSMTITVNKENEKTASRYRNASTDVSIEAGKSKIKNNLGISYEHGKDSKSTEDSSSSRTRKQVYNPVKKPYVPDNLLWYPHETSWFRLYQQRINGNILQHHDVMSSKTSHSINSSEKHDIKVALKTFFAEVKGNRDVLIESALDETETIEWEIFVEFESINNLNEVHTENVQSITPILSLLVKQQYEEEVRFMLEDDGIIDDKERRILDRLGDKLGISKQQALQIESEIISSGKFTKDEQEYLEEFVEMLNDGEITEKERRILDRFATRLDISAERIVQLELSVKDY